jgi:N-acetylglucosamine-6-phosphate deacetylase
MSGVRPHAVLADTVFDGETVHRDCAVVIDGARIAALVARSEVPAGMPTRMLPDGAWLAPGFIDVQVNGGGDVLFNDEPTPEGIAAIVAGHRKFGTTALLPTLITDMPEKMRAALDAVRRAAPVNPGVLGVHFEGPFLSPGKPGVHDPALIRRPDEADVALLCAPQAHCTVVTFAPEEAPPGFTARLAAAGVRVCLGHSMATYAQTKAALAEGLLGFTHLFNAMRPLESREPGPIAAALEAPGAWFGMIVDGVHVAPAMLRLALRGAAHPMLVTDAMPPVGGHAARFTLYGNEIVVRDGRCARSDGTLAGAALDMACAVRNCVRLLDVPLTEALRFASTEPAEFLGLGKELGRLRPGYRADMVAFDPDEIDIHDTWVAGGAYSQAR